MTSAVAKGTRQDTRCDPKTCGPGQACGAAGRTDAGVSVHDDELGGSCSGGSGDRIGVRGHRAKRSVIHELEDVCPASTILASNTSTISWTRWPRGCGIRERLIGMHFFNPAQRMPLVEVIRRAADATGDPGDGDPAGPKHCARRRCWSATARGSWSIGCSSRTCRRRSGCWRRGRPRRRSTRRRSRSVSRWGRLR